MMKENKNCPRIARKQAISLLKSYDLLDLGLMADERRKKIHPESIVTFVVDRNINYTNVCINKCKFCAFWRNEEDPEAYLLDKNTLFKKIEETVNLGGTQILLQGGLHPSLTIDYYTGLLSSIKKRFDINIHGLSPPEICYIADSTGITVREILKILKKAGLDSIPGGGAEILSDRIREVISPKKIKSSRWLEVMENAHLIGMRTTATMMFGSIEEPEDIILHLDSIRNLQDRTGGFTAFIPWSFQPWKTELNIIPKYIIQNTGGRKTIKSRVQNHATAVEYLKILAFSRIYLDNFENIQASWVTQGLKLAQVALRFGANDFGSTMIEENVVASTGVAHSVSKREMIKAIKEAGFKPAQRDTLYRITRKF
jgi:cyclic dehypoxanthinyl futalosine synthase